MYLQIDLGIFDIRTHISVYIHVYACDPKVSRTVTQSRRAAFLTGISRLGGLKQTVAH